MVAVLATAVFAPATGLAATAAPPAGSSDLHFTVLSVSAVYDPGDGSSVVFASLRNDDPVATLSLSRSFAVTFYDASGAPSGVVHAGAAGRDGSSLSSTLRAVPPGQLADVSARLPGIEAASAQVSDASAAGSPFADPRLPLSGIPERTALSPDTDVLAGTVVNVSGYPDVVHLAVLAEDAQGELLGVLAGMVGSTVPSGSSADFSLHYARLPGEPVADHYAVLAEGLPDGAAATSLTAPATDDTPVSGTPVTLRTRLLNGLGQAISGADVQLVSRRPGRLTLTLTHARTDMHGSVALHAVLPTTGELQLDFAGDATHAPAGTGDFTFRLLPRLTGSVPATVPAGNSVAVRGSLPDYPGETVTLQELVGAKWRTLRSTPAARNGAVRFTLRPSGSRHVYRLCVSASTTHVAASTGRLTLQLRAGAEATGGP